MDDLNLPTLFAERPSPPLNPGVVDYDRSKALLEWTKPQTDGGYAITHYRVRHFQTAQCMTHEIYKKNVIF